MPEHRDFNPFAERNQVDFLLPTRTFADRLLSPIRVRAAEPTIVAVDLSHWNGDIDFAQLRASGVQAVIIKCSEGAEGTYYEFKDPKWETNWRAALDEGFPVMAYHFFRDEKGSAEKSWFMKCADAFLNDPRINGKTACWLDVEWTGSGLSTTARSSRAFGFCELIRGEGMQQGVYCSPGLVGRLFPPNDPRWANVWQWVAHWTSASTYTLPSGWSVDRVKAWQKGIYDDHWWIPEVIGAGDVDYNVMYFASEDELRSWLGQVIAPPEPIPPDHEHLDLLVMIQQAQQDIATLYTMYSNQNDAIDDLEARDDALTSDIVDINRRLQEASDALQQGG